MPETSPPLFTPTQRRFLRWQWGIVLLRWSAVFALILAFVAFGVVRP